MAPSPLSEAQLVPQIRLVFGREFVIWRNSTGFAERDGRSLRFGLQVGSSDFIGIATLDTGDGPRGLFLAVEVKTAAGTVKPEQQRFLELVFERGGIACVCRSVAQAELQVGQIKNGKRRLGW